MTALLPVSVKPKPAAGKPAQVFVRAHDDDRLAHLLRLDGGDDAAEVPP
jgi:hypothetical protein